MLVAVNPVPATLSFLRNLCPHCPSVRSSNFLLFSASNLAAPQIATQGAHAGPPSRVSDNRTDNSFEISVYDPSATVDSKAFTATLSPLETTFTKKRGEGAATINPQSAPQPPRQRVNFATPVPKTSPNAPAKIAESVRVVTTQDDPFQALS